MHGYGKYIWSDGKSYEGQYLDDKKHGYGVYSWPDGRVYKGYWEGGKQNGLGEYHVKAQSTVKVRYGLWEEGARKKWFDMRNDFDIKTKISSAEEEELRKTSSTLETEILRERTNEAIESGI